MTAVVLRAPLSGWVAPLAEVPDEAFAQQMLGDGVAIDPTGQTLHAPCDGVVISLAATKHAVAIRADNGAEILLHVGIDTVGLSGEGFEALVGEGARVRSGQALLNFALDLLARRAKSLVTPVILTNGERFAIAGTRCDLAVEVGDVLMEVHSLAPAATDQRTTAAGEATDRLVLEHEQGIHARPAAQIANFAKALAAEIAVVVRDRRANAKSAVALMSLGARRGDELTLIVTGEDARRTVTEFKQFIVGMAHEQPQPGSVSKTASDQHPLQPRKQERYNGRHDNRLRGVIASRGLAVGRAIALRSAEVEVVEPGRGIAHENAEFERARAAVRARLDRLQGRSQGAAREVITAHLEFLDDWELVAAARRSISRGKSAAYAWRRAVRDSADTLRALHDPRMTERVDDLLDLESQLLLELQGAAPAAAPELPERAILIAEDLQPSQFIALDAGKLAGICMAAGGPTSHVAILAAAMGIPVLVALGESILNVAQGAWLILDAEQGAVTVAPDQTALAAAEQTLSLRRAREQVELAAAHRPCHMADDVRVEVFANLGSLAEATVAVEQGAEGCGLLRTEFLFLDRDAPPAEDEQLLLYQGIAQALAPRPLVIRTLDIGGDKPIAYLPLPAEANPALGLRGVRTSLWRPDLLRVQLRAILRVQPADQCRVLLPMITDPAEIAAVRRMLEDIGGELGMRSAIGLGVMIETPASALLADRIAPEVDFLSIGTNDLTQYTLCMDRGHSELAHRLDGLHPAVLRLIAMTAQAAEQNSRIVAVCGGLASEPAAIPVLIGLGVRELSVVPAAVPHLKSLIRTLTLDACCALARQAVAMESAEAVRAHVNKFCAADSKVMS